MPKQTRRRHSRKGGRHTASAHRHHKKSPKQHTKRREQRPAEHVVVGKIYANWCGHCTALIPEWRKMRVALARASNPRKTTYSFVEIEQQEMDKKIPHVNAKFLAGSPNQLKLNGGFPTIFSIRNGHLEYYEGPRTHADLYKWFNRSKNNHTESRRHKPIHVPIVSFSG
jgi:hypothetical protein